MQKHHSCLNTRAIIEYFQEHYPGDLPRLLEGLGPEIDSLPNPLEFLMESNNWVSSRVVIQMFANARDLTNNERIAYEIGFQSAARKKLGYVQRIIMFAYKNPRRTLRRVQAINDKFNRNKTIEVAAATRDRAVVRLRWFKEIPAIIDFCLFNQGIYSGIPTIWDLPPARVLETKCFFKGDDCCEYHFKWERKPRWREAILRWSMPWTLLKTTVNELEQDKELLEIKFNEIHKLNIKLKEKIDQLICLQQSGTAALSFLNLEELLEVSMRLLIKFTRLDQACVFLADDRRRTFKLRHIVGRQPELGDQIHGYEVPWDETDNLITRVARKGAPVVLHHLHCHNHNPADPLFRALQPQACLLAPLMMHGRSIGVILAGHTRPEAVITESDKQFVVSFANQMAIALENARLYRRLEHSERRYRHLVENAHEGIWIITPDGVISFANPRMREIIGEERLEGRQVAEFWDRRNLELLERALARNRQGQVIQEELEISSPRRGQVAVSMSSVPLQENGRFLGAFAMFNDISDKKKLEKQILQQQKMEAIGTLAGGIAHNFNNILMNVMGLTGLILADSEPGAPGYDDLEQIEQEVLKGSALTRQLLSFGRGSQSSPQPLDINLLVERIARLFTRTRHDITISKNLAPGLPAVAADQGQMEQVILNLLVNAWQAMGGKGEIVLATAAVELPEICCETPGRPAGPYVHLTVADTGVGMDEATATRIFEPFFSTKEMGQGTGLGLATVYAIVKNHGGIIKVDSRQGQGATFHLYLPVTDKPVPADSGASYRFVKGTGTILLVDDEDSIRSVGKRILEQLGYEILLAENGSRALEIYQAHGDRVSLVILDMIMPGMGGRETYLQLQEINPRVKVLLSSGYSLNDEAQEIMTQGAQGFIQKPYRLDALSRKIAELL
jgi:two-component system, cell cycle sensor histidine kinase and response regulator CckA